MRASMITIINGDRNIRTPARNARAGNGDHRTDIIPQIGIRNRGHDLKATGRTVSLSMNMMPSITITIR